MKNIIRVDGKFIGDDFPCFIVAEIGVNHNRDLKLAKKLIVAASEAEADAVKFQTWKTENIILRNVEMAEYQKDRVREKSQFDMLKNLELPYEWHFELKDLAEENGLIFFSTMEDKESVDFLIKDLKISLIKVGSSDLTNYPLLEYTAKFGIPIVMSTGLATLGEIEEALRTVWSVGNKNVVLCQCTSEYPCPYEDVNLRAMITLKEAFKTTVGFSDHTLGIECAIAAVAMGAKYLEKHFTLDRNLPGPDHKASLEPHEFKNMVKAIRNVEKALGDGIKRPMPSELKNKPVIAKRIVALRDIEKGEILDEYNLTLKRANQGIEAKYFKIIKGRKAKRRIRRNEVITFDVIE